MTAAFLQNELQSLIQESKRKSPETRTAAEKSLTDLKGLSVTSESQLSGDLIRKLQFIDPFVFACRSRNVKLAATAVGCLQRLATGRAIPRERLSDVLDALRKIAALSLDVQLKILQTLPSLLQLYSSDIRGPLLAVALEICDALQASKTAVVSSTAEATFQQLVTTVYDRVSSEDTQTSEDGSQTVKPSSIVFSVQPAAHDAFSIFTDLCALANGSQPTFVQLKSLSPHFLLEVIGSIATNYEDILAHHPEQLEVCRSSLLPALAKVLATKNNFAVIVRALRTLYVLIRHHLQDMVVEFEDGLMLMINLLEPNSGQPWKRVLCMEVFRGLFSDASLFRDFYRLYDGVEKRKNVMGALLAAFVRIASEDPTLIGLGRQSTMPTREGDTSNGDGITSFEASDIGGAFGGVVSANANVTGLSTEWSTVKVPCLEQLDKSSLSDIPVTYIYSLVLNCISALAEGLSRFVMPLSVPSKVHPRSKSPKIEVGVTVDKEGRPSPRRSNTTSAQNHSRLINPLTLEGHPESEAVSSCARMLDDCWPAILATCSTFFNAALDADYHHNLVRAFQKLTQVSGILELATARDALLTSLSKAALPSSTNARLFSPLKQNGALSEAATVDITTIQSPQSAVPKEISQPRLSVRNLLCLRALLNLGIALGPSLGTEAWFIILETLERAESLILSASTSTSNNNAHSEDRPTEQGGIRTLFGVETAAVQTATKRMFESTSNYTDDAFILFVTSLFKLDPDQDGVTASDQLLSPASPAGTPSRARPHRANRSISGFWISPETVAADQDFMISKTAELARINLHRFVSSESSASSWQLLLQKLIDIFASQQSTIANRSKSVEEVDSIILEIVKLLDHVDEEPDAETAILKRCFDIFLAQLPTIEDETQSSEASLGFRQKSHAQLLATLESVIGHCGDTLTIEWTFVLKLISSAFEEDYSVNTSEIPEDDIRTTRTMPRSEAILQRAFACLQLLVSDFLEKLQISHIRDLTLLLFSFGSQTMVLNISLTATTFFWNVASFLLESIGIEANGDDDGAIHYSSNGDKVDARKTLMLLFARMSSLGLDSRADVRQSSSRMTMKVLDAAGDQLSPPAWNICIVRLLAVCSSQVDRLANAEEDAKLPWQEATIHTLRGITDIARHNMQEIAKTREFSGTWAKYVRICGEVLDQMMLPISSAVFGCLSTMLDALRLLGQEHMVMWTKPVLEICLEHHPADIALASESNQAALTQYATTLATIMTTEDGLEIDLRKVLSALERTVLLCMHPPYTSDAKRLAPEQEAVISLLPQIQRLVSGTVYTDLLQSFIKAPLSRSASTTKSNEPTFIALAARCSDILRTTVTAALKNRSETGDVTLMLNTLSKVIVTKYTSLHQGGDSPLWRQATTSAVEITKAAMESKTKETNLPEMTASFTAVAASILNSGGLPKEHEVDLADEESFDISSFEGLHATIIPKIGDTCVPLELLKSYVLTLFHASLVAEPLYFDLPDDLLNRPLESVSTVRPGTVCDPVYAKRNRICYTALNTLFSLVATGGRRDPQSLRLAQTVAPYVLLRCAYSFKNFIADQPLRSISALPGPLCVELLTILNKCIELRCEEKAFTGIAKGNDSDGKAHLRLLNGIFVRLEECWRRLPRKETGVSWHDRKNGKEIEGAFARWKACLAEGWEIMT